MAPVKAKLKPCPPDRLFDPKQLRKGTKVEYEHSTDRATAKCIAKHHLMESPRYYIELEKMEKRLGVHGYGYIKKTNGKFCVKSEDNPRWSGGCYPTRKQAQKRLRQVEWFKRNK